tara:strand:+ start:532 stop:792 length:261 start_codon:yes stop_codon:yes gene_type:complete
MKMFTLGMPMSEVREEIGSHMLVEIKHETPTTKRSATTIATAWTVKEGGEPCLVEQRKTNPKTGRHLRRYLPGRVVERPSSCPHPE